MKMKFHRVGALALSLCLTLGLCAPAMAAEESRATAEQDGDFIRGTFYFDPHEGSIEIGDLSDTYIYSDSYFQKSSSRANEHLATMSMQMAAASISSCSYNRTDDAYATRSRNVTDLLSALGFQQPEVNEYYNHKMNENTMGAAVAYKAIDKDTVVLAIIPRSAGYEIEWSGNFNVGTEDDGLHAGFKAARDIVLSFAKDYVTQHEDVFAGKTLKVWTVGYSRGAGVANLIGAAVAEGYNFSADEQTEIKASPKDVYAYTFGTPATVLPQDGADPRSSTYAGIHNYYSSYDPVKMMPFSTWGFTRYGQDTLLPTDSATSKTQMLSFLQKINENVYNKYVNEGGDPDTFTAMKVDLATKSLVPDTDSELTQETFFQQRIDYLTKYLVPDRETYVNEHFQDMLCTMMVLNFGGDGNDTSRLLAQVQSEDNRDKALMAAGAVVIYAVAQSCADQYGAETQLDIDGLTALVKQLLTKGDDLLASGASAISAQEASAILEQASLLGVDGGENGDTSSKLNTTYGQYAKIFYDESVRRVKDLLDACVEDADFTNLEKENLPARLTNEETFVKPFVKFVAGLACGVELSDAMKAANSLPLLAQLQLNNAATLYANSGKYMRVHNNEVLVSWLRTMDSYYTRRDSSGSGSSSGSSETTYTLTADAVKNGTVQLSATSARAGVRITVTAAPADGYELSSLTAVDKNDKAISLTDAGSGKYTFTMPSSAVTVKTVFSEKAAEKDTSSYGDFTDLTDEAWYQDGVEYALKNGLMKGESAAAFAPNADVTRAQIVTILWRMEEEPVVNYAMTFQDVAADTWYTEAIRWAASTGVVTGYSDESFGPNDAVTREQLAAILYRFAQSKGMDVSVGEDTNIMDYDDVREISSYAIPAIQWAAGEGVITGISQLIFSPKTTATRAQTAVVIQRFCEIGK